MPDRSDWQTIRIHPEFRNFHVELAELFPEILFLYRHLKYDLREHPNLPNVRQVSLWEASRYLANSPARILEIWEPLWVRYLGSHILLSVVWKVQFWRGRELVSYAMENNDVRSLVNGRKDSAPRRLAAKIFQLLVGLYVTAFYTRLAYSGPSSRASYAELYGVRRVDFRFFEDLPSRPLQAPKSPNPVPECVFVGRLEARKGVGSLLSAWEIVERALPAANLRLIGTGPELQSAVEWAKGDARRIVAGEQSHDQALAAIAVATVLALPSERDGRWREQIGLPIREALQAGLTVVTTSETGLSAWLQAHGHLVTAPADPAALAESILRGLTRPLDRDAVVASLPDLDGEVEASFWLHRLPTKSLR